jgi:hypothetical protein
MSISVPRADAVGMPVMPTVAAGRCGDPVAAGRG